MFGQVPKVPLASYHRPTPSTVCHFNRGPVRPLRPARSNRLDRAFPSLIFCYHLVENLMGVKRLCFAFSLSKKQCLRIMRKRFCFPFFPFQKTAIRSYKWNQIQVLNNKKIVSINSIGKLNLIL